MFRLALSSHIYIFFCFRDAKRDTLSPCAPKHVLCGQREFQGEEQVGSKYRTLLFMCLGSCLVLHILGADESQEGRNSSCPLLRSCFIDSCHVSVSRRLSRSIRLVVYCFSLHICFIVLGPLNFLVSLFSFKSVLLRTQA